MNPNVGENQRQTESAPSIEAGEQVPNQSTEKSVSISPENKPQTQSVSLSSQAASDIALPAQAIATGLDNNDSTVVTTTASQADDTDRIEKEWVDKAKTVIGRTKDDPFEQKSEMSRVKADYIQKRFHKTIRTDDAVSK